MMTSPELRFRYSVGLGDIVASFLHSRLMGWLTHWITGRNKPCAQCNKRAEALNVLFPIPVWRLFYPTQEARSKALLEDFKRNGYEVDMVEETPVFSAFHSEPIPNVSPTPSPFMNSPKEGYHVVSTNELDLSPYIIKTEVYLKNER